MAYTRRGKKRYTFLVVVALAVVAFVAAWFGPELWAGTEAETEQEQAQPYQHQPEINAEEPPSQIQPPPEQPEQDYTSPPQGEGYQAEGSTNSPPPQQQNTAPPSGRNDDEWRLMLVSPNHPVGIDFTPPQLETISDHHQVDSRIAGSLRQMIASAAGDGITLMVTSAYRPATRQEVLHNQMIDRFLGYGRSQEEAVAAASTIVLPPGTSEHQTGLAVDIVTPAHQSLTEDFAYTPAGVWLAANAYRYGFILRYPRDSMHITGVIFEPWHFRYVGREHARAIFEGGYTLEEYLAR